MAVGLPLKTTYVNGEVYSASDVNDTNGTVNLLNPTAKGSLISASAANTPSRLAVGANDTVLTADSTTATGLKWATANSGLNLISSNSFTTVSSFSLPADTFTSAYVNYRIVATIVSSNTSITNLSYRLRAAGTDATGFVYDFGFLSITNSGGPTRTWNAGENIGIIGRVGNVGGILSFDIAKPQLAVETYASGMGSEQNNSGFTGYSMWQRMSANTAYDSMTFIPASGTITGEVSVYGYK